MNTPIPILFTIPNFITAGSGGAMLNIIRRLDRRKFAPAVAVLKKGGKLDHEVERLGLPLIEASFTLPAKPYNTLLMRAKKVAQVLKPYNFKIWHSFHYSEDYTEPVVARMSGAKAWIFTKKNMNWNTNAWRLRSLFATRILAQNTDMFSQFFSNWPFKQKTRLVPRGVDIQKFRPGIPNRLALRSSLNIPDKVPMVACVADLLPVKGHPSLLQALSTVTNVHFLLAGRPLEPEYFSKLQQQTEAYGLTDRVHFLGMVEDVPALLSEVDFFVLPTWNVGRQEGCPVSLLEAMASAKACIATSVPGSRDLIKHEKCGLLVKPKDSDELSKAIITLLERPDLRQQLGDEARQRVEKYYTIERETTDHMDIYLETMGVRK